MAEVKSQRRTAISAPYFWTDETSVLFTSLWGWSPDTWGSIGFTGNRGRTRRDNLLKQLSDPFITVCYVTSSKTDNDPDLKGKIAGFYLVSHQMGDRDTFSHPIHHDRFPDKWRHSLRAVRAFSYLPEHRLTVSGLDPGLIGRARAVSAMGEKLVDPAQIALLRQTPWVEVDIYAPGVNSEDAVDGLPLNNGKVKGGPASKGGYVVSEGTMQLPRQLYVLRLEGNTDAFLGECASGHAIYKIGLAVSPELRRQAFQKAMPRGAFRWRIDRTSMGSGGGSISFGAAIAGEDEMKTHLARCARHLGGEFYLATQAQINEAWQRGHTAAQVAEAGGD